MYWQNKRRRNSHCRDRVHYAVSDTTPKQGHPRGYFCFVCLSVVNSCRETPGPIPNPEAKPANADGTATGRLWESKKPPTPNNTTTQYNNKGETVEAQALQRSFSRFPPHCQPIPVVVLKSSLGPERPERYDLPHRCWAVVFTCQGLTPGK